MRTSYREPLSDLRKYLFSWDWLNAPGTKFREPSLCNGSPFPIDLRVRWVERTQQGVDDKRSFFDGEGLGFMYDFGCARHDRSPRFVCRLNVPFFLQIANRFPKGKRNVGSPVPGEQRLTPNIQHTAFFLFVTSCASFSHEGTKSRRWDADGRSVPGRPSARLATVWFDTPIPFFPPRLATP
jgi:hypothetical protein